MFLKLLIWQFTFCSEPERTVFNCYYLSKGWRFSLVGGVVGGGVYGGKMDFCWLDGLENTDRMDIWVKERWTSGILWVRNLVVSVQQQIGKIWCWKSCFSPPRCVGVVRFLSFLPSFSSSFFLPSASSSANLPCYIPPAASQHLSSQASTSIASSVKLSCYIPPAAPQHLSSQASTSIASSVKPACYIPPAAPQPLSSQASTSIASSVKLVGIIRGR